MANAIGKNPWVIDTESASAVFTGNILIDHFELIGYTVATDVVTVTDEDGDIIWQATGNSDISTVKSSFIGWVQHGLVPSDLPAGSTLLVYIGHPR